jgi:hypothetical protein
LFFKITLIFKLFLKFKKKKKKKKREAIGVVEEQCRKPFFHNDLYFSKNSSDLTEGFRKLSGNEIGFLYFRCSGGVCMGSASKIGSMIGCITWRNAGNGIGSEDSCNAQSRGCSRLSYIFTCPRHGGVIVSIR